MTTMFRIASRLMLVLMLVLMLDSCIGKRITKANVDQVTEGMSKKQVESILGQPTSSKTEDPDDYEANDVRLSSGQRHGYDRFQGRQSAVEGQHILRLIRCRRTILSCSCPPTSTHDSAEDSGLYSTKRDLPRITALG